MKESCGDNVKLILNVFERLLLKNNQIKTFDAITDEAVDDIFTEIELGNDLSKKETAVTLKDKPLLKGFLDHCCKQRTYYFSVKTCGNSECTTCQPVRFPPDVFERLHHLPDPIPDETNEGYCKTFQAVYGTETTEEFMPSKKNNSKQRA